MAEKTKLVAQAREISGSAASRRMRREGWLPGVVYNEKCQSRPIKLNLHDFDVLLHHHSSENLILDIEIDGKKPEKVFLKEVQHDPLTGDTLHADFVEISMTKKIRIRIPIALTGEAVGVSQEDGVLEHLLRELEVECLPSDIAEKIEVDVSGLKIGDAIQVHGLNVDPKLTVLTAADVAIASVSAPRLEEEPEEVVEAAEGAEPEVIGEEKKEEAPAEEGKGQKSEDGSQKSEEDKRGAKEDGKKKAKG